MGDHFGSRSLECGRCRPRRPKSGPVGRDPTQHGNSPRCQPTFLGKFSVRQGHHRPPSYPSLQDHRRTHGCQHMPARRARRSKRPELRGRIASGGQKRCAKFARDRLPSTGKPGLLNFGCGKIYSSKSRDRLRRGANVATSRQPGSFSASVPATRLWKRRLQSDCRSNRSRHRYSGHCSHRDKRCLLQLLS